VTEERKRFSLKKEAKTFAPCAAIIRASQEQKFFGSFFQKRTASLHYVSWIAQCAAGPRRG
jgi:hypothetical protein